MAAISFFGEINELRSRAVWYSDEEDVDSDVESDGDVKKLRESIASREASRTELELRLAGEDATSFTCITTCVLSIDSNGRTNQKDLGSSKTGPTLTLNDSSQLLGRTYLFEENDHHDSLLWLVIDSNHPYINGQHVGNLVTSLMTLLSNKMPHLKRIFIVSKQFSTSEHLVHLINSEEALSASNLVGNRMLPPTLIKNHFEAYIFEYCTISNIPCVILCLPDPRDFGFDRASNCALLPSTIVDHRLNDNKLDRSYIFN